MNDVVYLYGFVPATAPAPSEQLTGVADRAVELLPLGDFQAVMGRVPAAVYAESAIEPRLEDLGWVAEQGLAHERVVAWFVDHAQILPVPLFTLYSSTPALMQAAVGRAAQIDAQLRRLRDLREWDLKVGYRADRLAEHAGELSDQVRRLDREIESAAPGRRFLLERKRAELVKDSTALLARERARSLLDGLSRTARQARILPIPETRQELPIVLHAALLVDVADEARLADEVARQAALLDDIGVSVQYSGPWAPYRFLDGDDER